MTLSVSGRGLIALPAAMRKAAGIRPQDSLIAETTSEGILLRPAITLPVEIYTRERIAEFDTAESELALALELAGGEKNKDGCEFSSMRTFCSLLEKAQARYEVFWGSCESAGIF